MPKNYNFYNSLIQCLNTYNSSSSLINFANSMQYAERNNLYQILEILHVSQDIRAHVKLFSILAAYMGEHIDVVIKCNPLYDKICAVLARGLPQKTNVTLNFITSLLYTDSGDVSRRKTLVVYAQNMLRISGCLTAMANIFTSFMIVICGFLKKIISRLFRWKSQQETWRALCQCLAETCYGMEKNQNYCSHLIPLCVRRCREGNEFVFQLLQSLLHNNEQNIRLFYETGGHCIFSREFLKYGHCLQLLNTVIAKSTDETRLLEETNIIYELNDLKRLYGISSEVGQWATIILYAIKTKGPGEILKDIRKYLREEEMDEDDDKCNDGHELPNTSKLYVKKCGNDTSELFQNVIREVLNFEPRMKPRNESLRPNKPNITTNRDSRNKFNKIDHGVREHSMKNRNLKDLYRFMNAPKQSDNSLPKSHREPLSSIENYKVRNIDNISAIEHNISTRNRLNLQETKKDRDDTTFNAVTKDLNSLNNTILNFRPTIVSTPKSVHRMKAKSNNFNMSHISKRHSPISRSSKNYIKNSCHMDKNLKSVIEKNEKSDRQRTLGARIFDAINESCTTLVKTVKSVFKTKNIEKSFAKSTADSNEYLEENHCANSFTSYMRKRDAFLNEGNSNLNTNYEEIVDECFTCNDTLCLKQKIIKDDFLRENVKRLKLGINLYGCDFKKISRTLWRNESYMTPSVLYNLYRKLIAK